jgi:hypothetical protein
MEKKVLRYQMGNQNAVNRRRTDITMTKRTNNDLQNSTETEDFALRTPIKTAGWRGGELGCFRRVGSSCPTSSIRANVFIILLTFEFSQLFIIFIFTFTDFKNTVFS